MAREAALAEGERLVLRLHPRWKVLLRPVLILAVIVAATLALLIVVTPRQHSAPLRLASARWRCWPSCSGARARCCAGGRPASGPPARWRRGPPGRRIQGP
jgi:hypothetical protein